MWAEWMKYYDLRITKEDIEKYKQLKKSKKKKVRENNG